MYIYGKNDPVGRFDRLGLSPCLSGAKPQLDRGVASPDCVIGECRPNDGKPFNTVVGENPTVFQTDFGPGYYDSNGVFHYYHIDLTPIFWMMIPYGLSNGAGSADDVASPEYCESSLYQAGLRYDATGSLLQMQGLAFMGYAGLEALYFGTMTGGPGAAAALPTLGFGAGVYSVGSGVKLAGAGMRCAAGAAEGCTNAAVSAATGLVAGMSGVSVAASNIIDAFILSPMTFELTGPAPC